MDELETKEITDEILWIWNNNIIVSGISWLPWQLYYLKLPIKIIHNIQIYAYKPIQAYNSNMTQFFLYTLGRCLDDQDPDCAAVASVQLALDSYTTSSIHLSYLETQAIAWRTRIVSPQGWPLISSFHTESYIVESLVFKNSSF